MLPQQKATASRSFTATDQASSCIRQNLPKKFPSNPLNLIRNPITHQSYIATSTQHPFTRSRSSKTDIGLSPFSELASRTQQLQVIDVIRPAPAFRHHMVYCEIAEREVDLATVANTFLHSIQRVLVRAVMRQLAQVRSLRNIRTMSALHTAHQTQLLSSTLFDEPHREWRQVDTDPLTSQSFCSDASRRTTAERI